MPNKALIAVVSVRTHYTAPLELLYNAYNVRIVYGIVL